MNEDEKKRYIEALSELAVSDAEDNAGSELPQVNVGENRNPKVVKPYYPQDDTMGAARWQTQNDVSDFKANRAPGDEQMLRWAMANGDNIHYGGPEISKGRIDDDLYFRNNIESSYVPSGDMLQVPNIITNIERPDYIQRQMDSQWQELQDLKRMEAIDELRRRAAIGI